MHGDDAVDLHDIPVPLRDQLDRFLNLGKRRLAHQQPFALAGQEYRGCAEDERYADRGDTVEFRNTEQLRAKDTQKGDRKPEQCRAVFEKHRIDAGILALPDCGQVAQLALDGAELLQRHAPGISLEQHRQAEHDIGDHRIGCRFRLDDMHDALIEGDARAERENQQRDDEAPEIEFPAVAEWVGKVRRPRRAVQAVEQQQPIARVDHRMHAFRQHCRAAVNQAAANLVMAMSVLPASAA